MPKPVFISFRIDESLDEARALAQRLAGINVEAFLSQDDLEKSTDWREEIANSLDACEVFVVLGTETYGAPGSTTQGTWEELLEAKDQQKAMFVIKMCVKFGLTKTRMELNKLQMPS